MISYNFNKTENILYAKYSDFISSSEIKDFFEKIYKDKELPKNIYILQDERNAEFDDADINITEAIASISKLSNHFNEITVAIVQTSPVETAYSLLFKNDVNIKNYHVEIFSTKPAALRWLKSYINV